MYFFDPSWWHDEDVLKTFLDTVAIRGADIQNYRYEYNDGAGQKNDDAGQYWKRSDVSLEARLDETDLRLIRDKYVGDAKWLGERR